MGQLTRLIELSSDDNQVVVGRSYTCMDCDWCGLVSECDFDTEYDEFKDIDRRYPICPECGGGLEC